MADLLDGVARYFVGHGLVTYGDTVGVDCFLEAVPSSPDECVTLTLYGGPQPDSRLPDDEANLQVRTRARDPRVSRARAYAIYNQLHGERRIFLPDGTWLGLAIGLQSVPASLGMDDNGRHQHSINFRLDVSSPTLHRPE